MNRWPPCPQDPVSEVSGVDLWPCRGTCPKQPWPWLPGSAPTISWLPGVWWISNPAILPRGSREPLHTGSHGTPEGLSPRCPWVTCLIHTFMGCLPPCLTYPLSYQCLPAPPPKSATRTQYWSQALLLGNPNQDEHLLFRSKDLTDLHSHNLLYSLWCSHLTSEDTEALTAQPDYQAAPNHYTILPPSTLCSLITLQGLWPP